MLDDIVFVNAVQYIVTALLGALLLWVAVRLSPSAVKSIKDAWVIGRAYKPMIIGGVDQASDPLPRKLDGLLDRVLPADWDRYSSVLLPVVLRGLADALDDALKIPKEPEGPPVTGGDNA